MALNSPSTPSCLIRRRGPVSLRSPSCIVWRGIKGKVDNGLVVWQKLCEHGHLLSSRCTVYQIGGIVAIVRTHRQGGITSRTRWIRRTPNDPTPTPSRDPRLLIEDV